MQSYTALLESYHALNSSQVDMLDSEPSALEFMRYVARNRPFVVRRAARRWAAVEKWNLAYLKQVMGDQEVRIAVTPFGNADAPVKRDFEEGDTSAGPGYVFVQPSEERRPFGRFLESLVTDRSTTSAATGGGGGESGDGSLGPVQYAQSQNDNLRTEYLALFPDVQPDIDWARIALQQSPDAINIWIGTERSTTALHKDNYENVYVQVIGQKHFVLLPPIEGPCVNDVVMPQGWYERVSDGVDGERWRVRELPEDHIPVAIWDPDKPELRASRYSHLSRPLRVTLHPGDMLYLPNTWYHKVTQTCGPEGCI